MKKIEYKIFERWGWEYLTDNITINALNSFGEYGWILIPSTLRRHNSNPDIQEGFDALFYREKE